MSRCENSSSFDILRGEWGVLMILNVFFGHFLCGIWWKVTEFLFESFISLLCITIRHNTRCQHEIRTNVVVTHLFYAAGHLNDWQRKVVVETFFSGPLPPSGMISPSSSPSLVCLCSILFSIFLFFLHSPHAQSLLLFFLFGSDTCGNNSKVKMLKGCKFHNNNNITKRALESERASPFWRTCGVFSFRGKICGISILLPFLMLLMFIVVHFYDAFSRENRLVLYPPSIWFRMPLCQRELNV